MNTDEICELLLRLPNGAALVLPPDVERDTARHAIEKATKRDPALKFGIAEQSSPVTAFEAVRRYLRIERLSESNGE